jgi:hypothetical protein
MRCRERKIVAAIKTKTHNTSFKGSINASFKNQDLGICSRVIVWQVEGPEFKPQPMKKQTNKKQ